MNKKSSHKELSVKESALLDEQNRAAALSRNEPIRPVAPSRNSRNEVATHPAPTIARNPLSLLEQRQRHRARLRRALVTAYRGR